MGRLTSHSPSGMVLEHHSRTPTLLDSGTICHHSKASATMTAAIGRVNKGGGGRGKGGTHAEFTAQQQEEAKINTTQPNYSTVQKTPNRFSFP